MPFFLKNTIFVARKILTTTDRHLLERAIFIGSCLLHHRWRSLYEGDDKVKAQHPSSSPSPAPCPRGFPLPFLLWQATKGRAMEGSEWPC